MKVTIHYTSRFGFKHSQELTTASKIMQAVRVLHAAGCAIKWISFPRCDSTAVEVEVS